MPNLSEPTSMSFIISTIAVILVLSALSIVLVKLKKV